MNDSSSLHHSVTSLIRQVKVNDPEAAGEIWNRYLSRLLRLAEKKMRQFPNRAVDADDVMVSVFTRFFEQAADGRFKSLDDRDDLWQILVMLTERKIIDQFRRASAEKRGGGKVVGAADLANARRADQTHFTLQDLVDSDQSPQYIAAFNELLANAMSDLAEPRAKQVAELTLSGWTKHDIAKHLDVAVRTVERKLDVIREIWRNRFGDWQDD